MGMLINTENLKSNESYILLTFDGELTKDSFNLYTGPVLKAVEDHQCYKLLCDFRLATFSISIRDIVEIHRMEADILFKNAIPFEKITTAFVTKADSNFFSDLYFFKTISVDHGQIQKHFKDMDEARLWVNSK